MQSTATLVSARMVLYLQDEMSSVHLQVGALIVLFVEWNSKDAVLETNCLVHVSDFEKNLFNTDHCHRPEPSINIRSRPTIASPSQRDIERTNRDVEILLQYRTEPDENRALS